MRLPVQISGMSIVLVGHFNPMIFRPEWLQEKELLVGSDFEGTSVEIVHPEVVSLKLGWGQLIVDRDRFQAIINQEPSIRVHDLVLGCFQRLPETPITAVGINRDVHFDCGSIDKRNHIGDVLAPKECWGDFLTADDQRLGGVRVLTVEQSIPKHNRMYRLDGKPGWIRVQVEPSLRIPSGVYVQVNDHFDLTVDAGPSDGRAAAELISSQWVQSLKRSDGLVDRVMELADEV